MLRSNAPGEFAAYKIAVLFAIDDLGEVSSLVVRPAVPSKREQIVVCPILKVAGRIRERRRFGFAGTPPRRTRR